MLSPGNSHDTMLITVKSPTFLAEAATTASVSTCRHDVYETRQPENVLALAGRHAG
jgi:hypothetical protein